MLDLVGRRVNGKEVWGSKWERAGEGYVEGNRWGVIWRGRVA